MTYYIVTRSLRNGAMSFVCSYDLEETARRVSEFAQYGKESVGPQQVKYEVITSH